MARVIYRDERGNELWRSELGEHVPPGVLVTGPDGSRYLAATTKRDGDEPEVVTVRPLPQ